MNASTSTITKTTPTELQTSNGLAATTSFDPALESIVAKVNSGERLSFEDGQTLFATPDIWTVCSLADTVRRRLHGDVAFYNINRHINYSNICALSCSFCGFYRKKDEDGAYEFSIDDIRKEAKQAAEGGATELHIVGGLHPWLPFSYYTDVLKAIREVAPEIHIKGFTAVEIVHLAKISKRGRDGYEGIKAVIQDLKDAGLGSLPGGGAEVFDDRVHDEAFKGKIRSDKWMDVHQAAHELGLNSNATMLYGHIEQTDERLRHMMMLRQEQDRTLLEWAGDQGIELQSHPNHEGEPADGLNSVILYGPDESFPKDRLPTPDTCATGYYQTIIPLPFFPNDSDLEHLPGPSGLENLRTIAICRLMLDNFPHVKAFWIMQTLGMAQFMLQNGADDIDGTVVWYDITKVGGATTHQETTVRDLERACLEAGFTPIERDTLYRPVTRDGAKWSVEG